MRMQVLVSKASKSSTSESVIDGSIDISKPLQLPKIQVKSREDVNDKTIADSGTDTNRPKKGQVVYRVCSDWGRIYGASWTPVNPLLVSDFRERAGLPSGGEDTNYNNTGELLVTGMLINPAGIKNVRSALPLDGNKGGGVIEYEMYQPVSAYINIMKVEPMNNPF